MPEIALTPLTKIKIFAFVITVILVLFYDYLPQKTLQLHPKPGTYTVGTTDSIIDGNSEFKWINQNIHKWACIYKSDAPYPYCNITIAWSDKPHQPIDFSPYTHLNIGLEYEGEAEFIRIFIRNSYKDPSEPDELQSGKFNTVTKKAKLFEQVTPIYFNELRVSDWWIDDYKIPPNKIMPDIRKAIAIGIDIPHPAPLGKHEFHLTSLTAVGVYFFKESLYFSIILFWTALLLSEVIIKFLSLRNKSKKYSGILSKMSKQNAIYKEKSETDKLTQVLNREGLSQIVDNLQAQRLFQQYALIVLDLDHFKLINDKYGHTVGDTVLHDVAKVITSCMRSYDVIARWGGEEFVILFHCLDNKDLLPFAEKIRSTIESTTFCNDKKGLVTASIGVAQICNHSSFDEAFQKADKAVFAAKSAGRNKSIIY